MNNKRPVDYEVIDFLMDDRFINYHFKRNPEDFNFWKNTLITHPELQARVTEALDLLRTLTLTLPEAEVSSAAEELNLKISSLQHSEDVQGQKSALLVSLPDGAAEHEEQVISGTGHGGWSRRKKTAWWVAAASIILIGTVMILFRMQERPSPLLAVNNPGTVPLEFNLKDGTTIRLAAHSILHYPTDFNEKERKVYLEGQASFHVTRDTHHPFKVFSGDLVATVLGTIFNIEKNSADSSTYIELLKGSLKVEMNATEPSRQQTIYLNPNERVVYRASGNTFLKESWSPDTLKNNLADHLVFRNADFDLVAEKIKEAYGIVVINQSKKKKWHYTAEFKNVEFKEVLENICAVEGLKSSLTGDTVVLK